MLHKIKLTEIHSAIKEKLENKTTTKVYDVVPVDAPSPLLVVEFVGKKDASTKTTFIEEFTFYIHCLAQGDSSINIYNLIGEVEEALTEEIDLGNEGYLARQREDGIIQLLTEETGEKHAVIQYTFGVCYGFKCKI